MRNENKGYFEIMSTLFIIVVTFIIKIVADELNEPTKTLYITNTLILLFIGASFTFTDIFNRTKHKLERPDVKICGVASSAWATSIMDTIIVFSLFALLMYKNMVKNTALIALILGLLLFMFISFTFKYLEGRELESSSMMFFFVVPIPIVVTVFVVNFCILRTLTYGVIVPVMLLFRVLPEYMFAAS